MGFGRDGTPVNVDTRGGKIVRIRPLHYKDYGYDESHMGQWSLEKNGKVLKYPLFTQPAPYGLAYKKRVYSANRIKYPLQRVDWEPGGVNVNPQNRGKSKYKRISWDKATTMIASEIKRLHDTYGYFSILAQADGHGEGKCVHGPHGCQTQLLRLLGPDRQSSYTLQIRTPDSWEGWYWGSKHMIGWETRGTGGPSTNLTKDMVDNCDTIFVWGKDSETTPWAFGGQSKSAIMFWMHRDVGIEMVYVCPDLNYAAAIHADKWIPILSCMDGVLCAAIAYVWFTEDTYDKDFIARGTVGFDKYKAYIMGDEDGIPKTPAWASPYCKVPVWTIKAMARNWYQRKTTIGGSLGPGMRGTYAHEATRLLVACEAMQGIGSPGRNQYTVGGGLPGSAFRISFDRGPGARGLEEGLVSNDDFRPHQFLPETLIAKALIEGTVDNPITWFGTASPNWVASDQFRPFQYPIPAEEGGTEIRMVWTDTPCWMTCWNGGFRYAEALQMEHVDLVVTEHPWLENETLLSDIILPTTTRFEEYDIESGGGHHNSVWMVKQAIQPIGESKTDYEVSLEVAKKLDGMGYPGVSEQYTQGNSVEDWVKIAFDSQNLSEKVMSYEDFVEKEFWVVPDSPDWEAGLERPPGKSDFYNDPAGHPLQTPTGLIEFESTALLEHFPDDKERNPVPHWVTGGPESEGWMHNEDPLGSRAEMYPLMIISNHPRWRCHGEHDDIAWTREIPTCKVMGPDGYNYEPIWLNPKDAADRGIKSGDIIGMTNDYGTVLGGAYVTERLSQGNCYQDHGAHTDPIVNGPDEWIDRSGVINCLCSPGKWGYLSKNAVGQICSGFLVQVAKVDMEALRVKYPEAFARDYDPGYGTRFNGWVEGGLD